MGNPPRLDSTIPEVHGSLGLIAARMDEPEEAIGYFRKALELDPDNARAHVYLGDAYRKLGRAEDSKRLFERARQLRQQR